MLIPIWSQTLFGNKESPNGNFLHFFMGITIWKRRSPYGKHSHMGVFPSISKWAQTLFGNGLGTEPSPYGNGDVSILLARMRHVQLNGKIIMKRGWLYRMEMDSYKSRILDGVLVKKWNRMSRCLKLHVSVSQFLVLNVHIPAYLGSRGKPFLWNFEVFLLCLPIVDQYKFVYNSLYCMNLHRLI